MKKMLITLALVPCLLLLAAGGGIFLMSTPQVVSAQSQSSDTNLRGVVGNLTGTLRHRHDSTITGTGGIIDVHGGGSAVGISGGGSDGQNENNGTNSVFGSKWHSNAALSTYLQPVWNGAYPEHFIISTDLRRTGGGENGAMILALGYDLEPMWHQYFLASA
jgi:hypothetical protein